MIEQEAVAGVGDLRHTGDAGGQARQEAADWHVRVDDVGRSGPPPLGQLTSEVAHVGQKMVLGQGARRTGRDVLDDHAGPEALGTSRAALECREIAPGVHFLAGFGNTTIVIGSEVITKDKRYPPATGGIKTTRSPGFINRS